MPPESLEALRTMDRRKVKRQDNRNGKKQPKPKYMEGDSKYDILANVRYCLAFGYQELDMRNQIEDY